MRRLNAQCIFEIGTPFSQSLVWKRLDQVQVNIIEASLARLHQPLPGADLEALEARTDPAWQRLKFDELLAQQLAWPRQTQGSAVLPLRKGVQALVHAVVQVARMGHELRQCCTAVPRHQFGRYSDGAPLLWNHLGFDRAAMQQRQEGSVVVEMLNLQVRRGRKPLHLRKKEP